VLATVHIACILARLIHAFIFHVNDAGGASLYLADIGNLLNRSKDMVYITLVGYSLFNAINDSLT